jgi:hypothetical protein
MARATKPHYSSIHASLLSLFLRLIEIQIPCLGTDLTDIPPRLSWCVGSFRVRDATMLLCSSEPVHTRRLPPQHIVQAAP